LPTKIGIFLLLLLKHAVVDLWLQSYNGIVQKTVYVSNAHKHYLQHAIFTFAVLFFFGPVEFVLLATFLDYVAHWHIDLVKSRIVQHFEVDRQSSTFWTIQAVDQALHYLTYFLIVILHQQYVV